MRRRLWHGTAVLVAVIALSGCSGAPDDAPKSEPSLGPVPVITAPEQVTFPIDAFVPSVDQQVAIGLHGQSLVNECVVAHGGNDRYIIGEQDDVSGYQAILIKIRRESVTNNAFWGVFDPSRMRQFGYAAEQTAGNVGPAGSLDPILNACIQAVDAISPVDYVTLPFVPGMLPDGGSPWHPEDSRWVAAVREWSACMAERGYSFEDPFSARMVHAEAASDPAASAEAKAVALAVAVADLDCKLETNLIGKGVAIQSAYDQVYVDSHRDELAAQQAQIAAFLVAGIDALPDINSWTPGAPAPS